ncbi:MAG: peptidoglycan-binding protein, partial [Dehalococcoidia bacterium]
MLKKGVRHRSHSEARAAETQTALESKRSALAALESRAAETGRALEAERAASVEARALMELLNRQVAALRTQLRGVQAALDASDAQVKDQKLKVA